MPFPQRVSKSLWMYCEYGYIFQCSPIYSDSFLCRSLYLVLERSVKFIPFVFSFEAEGELDAYKRFYCVKNNSNSRTHIFFTRNLEPFFYIIHRTIYALFAQGIGVNNRFIVRYNGKHTLYIRRLVNIGLRKSFHMKNHSSRNDWWKKSIVRKSYNTNQQANLGQFQ